MCRCVLRDSSERQTDCFDATHLQYCYLPENRKITNRQNAPFKCSTFTRTRSSRYEFFRLTHFRLSFVPNLAQKHHRNDMSHNNIPLSLIVPVSICMSTCQPTRSRCSRKKKWKKLRRRALIYQPPINNCV